MSCSTIFYATGCAAGYFLTAGACNSCGIGANLCFDATTASTCLTSAGFFGPVSGICNICASGALTCSSA